MNVSKIGVIEKLDVYDVLDFCMKDCDFSYDIYFRMAVIDNYLHDNKKNIWDLYNKMQLTRCGQIKEIPDNMRNHKDEFIELINNFKENGFSDKYPLSINKNYQVIDGAHRIACSLYFGIDDVYVVAPREFYDVEPRSYDKQWFIDNGLDEIINYAEEFRKIVRGKRNVQG